MNWRGAAWASRKVNTQAKPEKRDKSISEAVEEDLQELSAEGKGT